MVGVLIFIGIIVVVMGGMLGGGLWMRRARPGRTRVVLLGVAGGEAEARLWA